MSTSAQPDSTARVGLEVDHLTVAYGGLRALSNVSLSVPPGRIVAVVGPNGAGKSSLLRCISGLVKPASGHCSLDGRSLDSVKVAARSRLGIGHVPEGRRLFPALTVRDNLRVAEHSSVAATADAIERQMELFPELDAFMNRRADSLSGGEQQMVAIARALVQQPTILLMDEPSLGLAPIIVQRLRDAFVRVAQSGTAVLLAEQNVELALRVSDEIHVLVLGDLVGSLRMTDRRQARGEGAVESARQEIMDLILAKGRAGAATAI